MSKWYLLLPLFALIVGIQPLIYYLSTGSAWVYSYDQEVFDFADPYFLDILFSYKKGLFLYTPIYLVSFLGLIYFWKKQPFRFWSLLLYFCLITYVFSSWWMWYYGGSFSSRVYVEYLPFFMLSLGAGLKSLQSRVKKVMMVSLIILLTIFCQLQSYQYRYYIIHYSEMTKELYWDNFLELKKHRR